MQGSSCFCLSDACCSFSRHSLPLPSRNFKASGSYIKSYLRKGQAFLGLGLNREAVKTLDEGAQQGGAAALRQHSAWCCSHPAQRTLARGALAGQADRWGADSEAPARPPLAGLKMDPFNPDLKLALQQANQAMLQVRADSTHSVALTTPHRSGSRGHMSACRRSRLCSTSQAWGLRLAALQDLAEGRGRETKAIEYPEARQRISYHP